MNDEKLLLEVINNLCDGVYFVDRERRITFWNHAAERITGYNAQDIIGQSCHSNLLKHIDKTGCALCLLSCPLQESILDGQPRRAEVFLRHKDGYRIPVTVNIFPIVRDGQIEGAVEIFTPIANISYEDDLIERLTDLAMNDPLTGLANRRRMEGYLEYRFRELSRFSVRFCVVFFDLDNFRAFNNTYGHEVGDEVLRRVAQSVTHSMRKSDLFGRWGGEEFVGVLAIKKEEEAYMLAEKLRVLIAGTEISHGGETLSVTASFGVTVARENDTIESVVKRADSLMYQSKRNNKNCTTADAALPAGLR